MSYEMGQRIWFTARLSRVTEERLNTGIGPRLLVFRIWERATLGKMSGIVVGRRTLTEGEVQRDYDEGNSYRKTKHFEVYLVAFDMRCNPVYVLPEDCEKLWFREFNAPEETITRELVEALDSARAANRIHVNEKK